MPTLYPLAVLPWVDQQWADADGEPLIGGTLTFYIAGTSTPAAVYADPDGDTAMTNPVVLDGSGRPEQGLIYVSSSHGYKVIVRDAGGAELYTRDLFEDVGAVFAQNFGTFMTDGAHNVNSGYQILTTDRMVTVDSTGGPDPAVITLPSAAAATQMLTVKNFGNIEVDLTPSGSDTIDGNLGAFTIPAAVNPIAPTVVLASDGVASWYLIASHGVT